MRTFYKKDLPPEQIQWRGLTLTRYSKQHALIRDRYWWTYCIAGVESDTRLWEHCPETGEIIQTQE